MKRIMGLPKQLMEWVKDIYFVGVWKYLKGYRPASKVLKPREELYVNSMGISPLAKFLGSLGHHMDAFVRERHKAVMKNFEPWRVQAVIQSQPNFRARRRRPKKESIAA